MAREVGGGFRMGNTCTPMADSCKKKKCVGALPTLILGILFFLLFLLSAPLGWINDAIAVF